MNIVITIALVIGGSVIFQLVGMAWYGPLFGKQWMRSWGVKAKDLEMTKEEQRKIYGGSFAAGVVTSLFILLMASNPNVPTAGLLIGVTAMVVFAASVSLASYLFEKRPLLMWVIHYGYVLTASLITALVMGMLV